MVTWDSKARLPAWRHRQAEDQNREGKDSQVLNLLLVDDHELFRAGVKLLLAELDTELHFVEASDLAAALALARAERFDVVLLDLHLPDSNGVATLTRLHEASESAAIVALSGEDDPYLIRQIIDAGAAGFIPKSSTPRVMLAALRLVLAGGTYLPPHVLSSNGSEAARAPHIPDGPLTQLSERQIESLRRAMQGKPNKVIAREMLISEATVKAHLATAFRVLGVKNRTEAVFAAARAGLSVLAPPR